MVDGDFELRAIDWTLAKASAVALMLVSSGVHLALATSTGQHRYAVLGLGLLVCLVIFVTDLWQPRYYLACGLYVGAMSVVWALSGMPMMLVGIIDTAGQVLLFGLFVYLFVAERRDVPAEESSS